MAPIASVLRSAFDLQPVAQCLLSPSTDPMYIAVNEALIRVVGRTRQQLEGKRVFEVFPSDPDLPEDSGSNAMRSALQRVIQNRLPYSETVRYPIEVAQPDGTSRVEDRYWSTTTAPILDESGEIACLLHHTEDVTEQRRLNDALRITKAQVDAALKISRLGTFEWNLKTGRVAHSDRSKEIFGFASTEGFSAEEYFERMHPDDLGQVKALIAASLAGEGFVQQSFRLVLPGGELRYIESVACSERGDDGEWERHIGVAIDVTDRVRREQALQEARRQDEFLAMLAHELRNPLAPIAAAAHLLQLPGADATSVQRASAIIGRQVRHMTSLIEDLLDVSRVTRGQVQLQLEEVDLRQAVQEAIEQVRPLIDAMGHKLATNTPPKPALVLADPKRLVQVVTNLLSNSAKYTPRGGQIIIDLEVHAGQVHLSVSDTGVGMSATLLEHCFDLFVQGERSSERAGGGLGIGLALVRRLVELHQGRLHVQSQGEGKGSRFTVSLPNLPQSSPIEPVGPEVQPWTAGLTGSGLSVLVVDDNRDAAEMLGALVSAMGHCSVVENDPCRAPDFVRRERPDVCLVDIGMPVMDGYELARRLRAQEGRQPILVAVTGYGQPQDRERTCAAGFDAHLTKPVDIKKLAELLSSGGAIA